MAPTPAASTTYTTSTSAMSSSTTAPSTAAATTTSAQASLADLIEKMVSAAYQGKVLDFHRLVGLGGDINSRHT
jgi:hypothetical protein